MNMSIQEACDTKTSHDHFKEFYCGLPASVTRGDMHQGESIFPANSRGRQCMSNCFVSLAYATVCHITKWTSSTLRYILTVGDEMHRAVLNQGQISKNYLLPEDLPTYFMIREESFKLRVKHTYSGVMCSGSCSFDANAYTLDFACFLTFLDTDYCIIVFNDCAVSVHHKNEIFYVFDSHSRGPDGLSHSAGTCTLSSFENRDSLCSFLRQLAQSLSSKSLDCTQFDIHTLSVKSILYGTFCKQNGWCRLDAPPIPPNSSSAFKYIVLVSDENVEGSKEKLNMISGTAENNHLAVKGPFSISLDPKDQGVLHLEDLDQNQGEECGGKYVRKIDDEHINNIQKKIDNQEQKSTDLLMLRSSAETTDIRKSAFKGVNSDELPDTISPELDVLSRRDISHQSGWSGSIKESRSVCNIGSKSDTERTQEISLEKKIVIRAQEKTSTAGSGSQLKANNLKLKSDVQTKTNRTNKLNLETGCDVQAQADKNLHGNLDIKMQCENTSSNLDVDLSLQSKLDSSSEMEYYVEKPVVNMYLRMDSENGDSSKLCTVLKLEKDESPDADKENTAELIDNNGGVFIKKEVDDSEKIEQEIKEQWGGFKIKQELNDYDHIQNEMEDEKIGAAYMKIEPLEEDHEDIYELDHVKTEPESEDGTELLVGVEGKEEGELEIENTKKLCESIASRKIERILYNMSKGSVMEDCDALTNRIKEEEDAESSGIDRILHTVPGGIEKLCELIVSKKMERILSNMAEKKYACKQCGANYPSTKEVYRHYKKEHAEGYNSLNVTTEDVQVSKQKNRSKKRKKLQKYENSKKNFNPQGQKKDIKVKKEVPSEPLYQKQYHAQINVMDYQKKAKGRRSSSRIKQQVERQLKEEKKKRKTRSRSCTINTESPTASSQTTYIKNVHVADLPLCYCGVCPAVFCNFKEAAIHIKTHTFSVEEPPGKNSESEVKLAGAECDRSTKVGTKLDLNSKEYYEGSSASGVASGAGFKLDHDIDWNSWSKFRSTCNSDSELTKKSSSSERRCNTNVDRIAQSKMDNTIEMVAHSEQPVMNMYIRTDSGNSDASKLYTVIKLEKDECSDTAHGDEVEME